MNEYSIPKHAVAVHVLFDGLDLFEGGEFYLADETADGRPEQLVDFLNQPKPFVPFHTDGTMALINLDAVVAVRTREPAPSDSVCTLDLQTTFDGLHLTLRHVTPLPAGHDRIRDYLNSGVRFLGFAEQGRMIYLHSRHIARVVERIAPGN